METQQTTNLSSPSSHRLPTVSASQALQSLGSVSSRRAVPTGLARLDAILQDKDLKFKQDAAAQGGLSRGQVTEISGPSGVGTTAFALQAAVHALLAGSHVVWVDCSFSLPGPRLKQVLLKLRDAEGTGATAEELLSRFEHYSIPSLPHLLALLLRQSASFPPRGTSLIVIESISTLMSEAFPLRAAATEPTRSQDESSRPLPTKKSDPGPQQWASGRRWAIISEFLSKIGKLAAMNNIAVLITTHMTTRTDADSGETMFVPGISSSTWDAGIPNRIILFRDWPPSASTQDEQANSDDVEKANKVRYAAIYKVGGALQRENGIGKIVTYVINEGGMQELDLLPSSGIPALKPTPMDFGSSPYSSKRKHDEVADSQSDEEEEFGGSSADEFLSWDVQDEEKSGESKEEALQDIVKAVESEVHSSSVAPIE
ncbi:MAG: hypothetical protein M4579_001240 [Chaenotheca gracillima]|nr:MAG: hypothetical protein M4579_001240 [Chaenotheca gracillima]